MLKGRWSLLATLSLAIFTATLVSSVNAGPKEDALKVIDRWVKAFEASDVDAIVKLYSKDVLFMGTASKAVVKDDQGIRKYFENALLNNRPRTAQVVSSDVLVLSNNAVLINGIDSLGGTREGKLFANSGRVTFIVAKRGKDWQIVHLHRSAMPN